MDLQNLSFDLRELSKYQAYRKKLFHPKSDIPPSISKKLAISKRKIASYITKKFSEEVISIVKMNVKSTFHDLYHVITETGNYVIKINDLSDVYVDFTFYEEMFMQTKLEVLGLPFIKVHSIDLTRSYLPFDFMIMDFVQGNSLEIYKGRNKNELYLILGRIFKDIHSIPVSGSGIPNIVQLHNGKIIGQSKNWKDFFLHKLEEHIDKVYGIGVINDKQKKIIQQVFLENISFLNTTDLSLVHNDPGARNIMTDGRKITAFFDWEDMIIGDSVWDIAFIESFLYRGAEKKLFESFCKGYGVNVNDLHHSDIYWLYYLRIALIKTISRSQSGYYDMKGMVLDKKRISTALRYFKHRNDIE